MDQRKILSTIESDTNQSPEKLAGMPSISASDTNRSIHVCHIILSLGIGGMENGLVHLIQTMNPHIFRHTVLCLADAGPLAEKLTGTSTKIIVLGREQCQGQWGLYKSVYKAVRNLRPDVVHTRNLSTCDLPLIARCAGVKAVVHSEHGLDEGELRGEVRRYIWVRRFARPFVSQYITLGSHLKAWLVDEVGVPPKLINITYNGVDPKQFSPLSPEHREKYRRQLLPSQWPKDALVLGSVGRLSPIKNYELLLEALSMICSSGIGCQDRIRLILVGDGPARAQLEKLTACLGLQGHVYITGFTDDVRKWLACMNLFVLPSHCEGVSNTILEAQASGLPVIATAVGATPELVRDGETALLVRADDTEALVEKICQALTNPVQMTQLGQEATKFVQSRFTWTAMAGDHARVYYRAMGLTG